MNSFSPIILTLDAGGTNFIFNAIQEAKELLSPIQLPSNAYNLNLCLKTIIQGFEKTIDQLPQPPVAISFAFPGPADYINGIIGDLGNLPAFRGGVALGAMLEEHFQIPVFINNDGDLFAYGEAKFGILNTINTKLQEKGNPKQYKNLFGVTLGTGFGGGLVSNGNLYIGDCGASAEVWLLRNPIYNNTFIEESISARAIVREYLNESKSSDDTLTPLDVYNIAHKTLNGNSKAALTAFKTFGHALGEVLANIVTITDSPIVIGGGLSEAYPLFAPEMIANLNGKIQSLNGDSINRLELNVFNIEETGTFDTFIKGNVKQIEVPFSKKTVNYESNKNIFIGKSTLGTSRAISLGAYAYALDKITV